MPTLLVKNIHTLLTMDASRREIKNGYILVRDGVIEALGSSSDLREGLTDEMIDASHHIVLPGLINTHHHMVQSLTRVIAQNDELFGWLKALYPIWSGLSGEAVYTASKLAMAELMLSGCTTSSDHLYIFPNDVTLDHQIQAAKEMGIRFHAARGAMSVGESKGGLPPDKVVEDEEFILKDTRRLIEQYHDATPQAMLRIVVAPCSPFTVSQDLMRESAALARSYGVSLHTHLAENDNDIAYGLEQFGQRPGNYVESVGWIGEDVWHAHCVKLDSREINLFGHTHTGVCHCPSSNMRLASGIAPIRQMLDARVNVGLGVDGSASNDGGHLLNEARQAMLLQRVSGSPSALSAREALEIATLGGASVLGRDDIGALAVGMSADFIAFRLDTIGFAGAVHDPASALTFCASPHVDFSVINGRVVVKEGQILTVDVPVMVEQHNKISRKLINGE
ncbi:MAG: 8-oxoguanine deaminase [Anaerolineaceae bacterium]|nr:8-oxoguanine deaminase [Anaerolineaceae bacterium]